MISRSAERTTDRSPELLCELVAESPPGKTGRLGFVGVRPSARLRIRSAGCGT